MGSLGSHLRHVMRRFGRAPMFTAVTLVTLAVGIGANTAIFSVLEGVLLKPLPYPHSEQLVGLQFTSPAFNESYVPLSPSAYFIFREQSRAFEDVGLYNGDSANVTGTAEPEKVQSMTVSDGALPLLGIPPLLGRWFSRADDSPDSPDTVILTYGYWHRRFGSDPSIVGKTLRMDGTTRVIIGVMPAYLHFPGGASDSTSLIVPYKLNRAKTTLADFSYPALARLKPGVSLAAANADVARMMPIVNRSFPAPAGISVKQLEDIRLGPNVQTLKQVVVGDVGKLLWILMGGIGMVLLIACANVANLLMVRAEGRQQELAVRAALGATPRRIAAELMFESLILSLLGSALGLGFAYGALRLLVSLAPSGLPRLEEIGIDGPALLFTLGAAVLTSLLFGALPVLKYSGAHLGTGLREGGRTLSESRERHRARNVLVVVQVALGTVLLISSALMVRTFRALTHVQPGFAKPAEVETLSLVIPDADVPEPERVIHMQEEILRRLAAIPGVSSVGMGTSIPMDGSESRNPVFAQDRSYREGELPPLRRFNFVSPGYFHSLGTPFVAGRDLTWTEVFNQRPVVIVSENLAREMWGEPAGALGKRIRFGPEDDWSEIVGVVANVHSDGVNHEPPSVAYWPTFMRHFWTYSPMVQRSPKFAIRSPRTSTESFLREVRQAVWSVDSSLPIADVHSLNYYYQNSMARTSFTLVMLGLAGGMALLLGIVGLYSVIAYSVSQRRREIGVRLALGAGQQEVTRMFVRHALWVAGAGVACGLGAAFALTRMMTSLLFGVSPLDPITYGTVSLGLVATAALASYLPSRRAATVDPVEALRAE
jgi:predicted permease